MASTLRSVTLHRCHQLQPSAQVDFQISILEFILVDLLNYLPSLKLEAGARKWRVGRRSSYPSKRAPKTKQFLESLLTQMVGSLRKIGVESFRFLEVSFFHWRRFHGNFSDFLGNPRLFFQLLHFALVLPHDLHCVLGETPRRSGDPLDLLPLARMLARTPARMTWHPWKIGNPELNLHVWLLLGGGVRPKKSPSYNLPRAPETNSQFTSLALKFWCLVRMKSPFRARPSSGPIAVSFRKCICWVLQKNTVTVDSIKVKNRDSLHTNEWID